MNTNGDKQLIASSQQASQDYLLNSILKQSPFVLWSLDSDGILLDLHGGGVKDLKLKPEEVIGKSIFELYADQPQLLAALREAMQGKEFQAVVHLFGAQVITWIRPNKDEAGNILGVTGVCLIGSELVATRNSGGEEGHCYEVLKRLANVGIFICNQQGKIIFANDFFWSCFTIVKAHTSESVDDNASPGDVYWQDLFQDGLHETAEDSFKKEIETGRFQMELKPVYSSRELEWVQVHLDRVGEDEWVGTVVDISVTKQTEDVLGLQKSELEKAVHVRTQELQLSKNEMEAILQNAVDIILRLDCKGIIHFVNHSISGIDLDKVRGRSLFDWVTPSHKKIVEAALDSVIKNQEHVSLEIPAILLSGDRALFATRWGPICYQGEVIGITVVARDITQKRQLEEEAKDRLDELSHLTRLGILGEITATISHELKQPLLAIGNYATGCLHRMKNNTLSDEITKNTFQLIAELSLKARKIVHKTRDFALKNSLERTTVNVQDLLAKSFELVQSELNRKNVILKTELDELVPTIYVDFIQSQQVVVNLILNAVEAIGNSKKKIQHSITIRSALQDDDTVQFTISDTADGIDEGALQNIFEMFNSGTKDGMGVGLAISRKIVERHDGKLQVLQTGPEGTTFEIIIPNVKNENDVGNQ